MTKLVYETVDAEAPAGPPDRAPLRQRSPLVLVLTVIGKLLVWGLLAGLVVAIIYPLLWMVLSGFKTNQEVFGDPFGLPGALRWENYQTAWDQGVFKYFGNSVIVTVVSVLTTTLVSAWAAYGLTRLDLPLNQGVLLVILGGLMLAPTVALVPLFRLLQSLELFNTYWALIILYTAFRVPFTTFLIRAYMIDLPMELDEAAKMDGASTQQIFWRIILPLCRPILVSAALLQALFAWNEFVFALSFISDDARKTLPVGLLAMQSRLTTDWPVVFAALSIAAAPMIILFLVGQRQFLRGLTEGVGK
ncbi:MAG TPA: carbohydrate ABC transporter permease [Nocardioidaceae bacterium]|nr:carbohydrate ABC transporter permease [Nocardioidaceae bacterium]